MSPERFTQPDTDMTDSPTERTLPLKGVRVLDLTVFLSGPYATQILGDLGAEVIKIEPEGGDQTRFLPPHFVGGDSAYYLSINRNKESLVLDYKTPTGLAVLERLVAESDVLIENLRPGNLARHGITYERLSQINPRLVWCSISGFGQDGPYATRPAYDMIVQALSGGMSLTGQEDGASVRAGIPLGDIAAGMYGVIGITAALTGRATTGKGQYIDVAMLDCQIAMLSYQAAYYLQSGRVPGRQGRGHESIPTYRSFTAGDGVDFVVCANTDRMWRSLCATAELSSLGEDPRLSTRQQRFAHRHEIWVALEKAFLAKPAEEWVRQLHLAEVPVALLNTLDKALADPQVLHRKMVVEMHGGEGRSVKVAGNPIHLPEAEAAPYRYPPGLGADSTSVLSRVAKLSPAEIASLIDTKTIVQPRPAD